MAFLPCEHTGERREVFQPLGRFAGVTEEPQQFLESSGRLLGALENLAPLFEPVGGRAAVGQPAVDVFERDAKERRPGRRVGLLQFVRHQIVQRFHGRVRLAMPPEKSHREHRRPDLFRGEGEESHGKVVSRSLSFFIAS